MLFPFLSVLCAFGYALAVPDLADVPQVWPLPNPNNFGAHIFNVNVENISDGVFDLVHEKLLFHKVIIVRNQGNLTVEGQRRFTQRFGQLHVHLESSSHYPGYSDVNVVSNIKNENGAYIGLFGAHVENFHSDLSW
jgi:alpha-ketoglutarate-dependent taurine dioxygenase